MSLVQVHALRTGTVWVRPRQLVGRGRGLRRRLGPLWDSTWSEPLPILAWLIEHPEGPILVDTGESTRAGTPGYFPAWHPFFRRAARMEVGPEDEIGPQLRRIGCAAADVRRVVMTHLHTDHGGGLRYFEKAEILVSRTEYGLARSRRGSLLGYLPRVWPGWFDPKPMDFELGHRVLGLAGVPLTKDRDVELLATPGHTAGHVSVLVRAAAQPVLIAGDATYSLEQLESETVDGVSPDDQVARSTLRRLHALVDQLQAVYLPSHDPDSVARLEASLL